MQDCGKFSALAMELPQSCTQPSICIWDRYPGHWSYFVDVRLLRQSERRNVSKYFWLLRTSFRANEILQIHRNDKLHAVTQNSNTAFVYLIYKIRKGTYSFSWANDSISPEYLLFPPTHPGIPRSCGTPHGRRQELDCHMAICIIEWI